MSAEEAEVNICLRTGWRPWELDRMPEDRIAAWVAVLNAQDSARPESGGAPGTHSVDFPDEDD